MPIPYKVKLNNGNENIGAEAKTITVQEIVKNATNKDIARLFGITEVGVQKHLKLIFAKIGAANRAEAITLAIKKQLLKI